MFELHEGVSFGAAGLGFHVERAGVRLGSGVHALESARHLLDERLVLLALGQNDDLRLTELLPLLLRVHIRNLPVFDLFSSPIIDIIQIELLMLLLNLLSLSL